MFGKFNVSFRHVFYVRVCGGQSFRRTWSFVSFGTSFNDLNIISGQQVYDIAYYIKDETDNDDFLLEDGTGVIMSEVSKPEGLRIQDMETLFPNTFIPKFSDHARDRTNVTYSAYVKSGTN